MIDRRNNLFQIEYFPLIDVAKLFCAVLVVMIHCLEVKSGHFIATFIVKCFSAQAVPFFMIASGFFAANKINGEVNLRNVVKLCIQNWLSIYCVWSVLWLPYYIRLYYIEYPDASFVYRILLIVIRMFFAGQGVYWYLLVLAEAIFIVYIFIRFRMDKALYCIGIIGLVLGIFYDANVAFLGMNTMHKIVYSIFSWSNNVFMKGIPYVAFGFFLRKRKEQLHFEFWKLAIVYFIASIGMVFFYILGKEQFLCLYPIQAGSLFLMAYQSSGKSIRKSLCLSCRNMSSAIYFLHTVFIYGIINPVFGVDSLIILKFSLSVMLSIAVLYVVKRMKIHPVEWLLCVR